MMRSLLRWMVLPLLFGLQVYTMQAQKVEWNLSAHAFIDNSEGNHHYAVNQTLTGLRLTPEIGISSHEATHRIMLGATGLSEWGNKGKISGLAVTAYYRYQKNGFKFTIGSFMRSTLEEEMESYLLSDSLKYYRPLMQGMHLSHTSSTHLLEAYLDWTGMRRGVSNEQFMLGMNAWNRWGNFKAGLKGYYYHYAFSGKRTNDDHIRDHALIRPFVSYSFTPSGILKDLEIKAGALIGLDRKRANVHEKEQGIKGQWKTPAGLLLEIKAHVFRFRLNETFYTGERQLPEGFRQTSDFYWSESYIHSGGWSRTDLFFDILDKGPVHLDAGVILHATHRGVNHHQVLSLKVDLSSKNTGKLHF